VKGVRLLLAAGMLLWVRGASAAQEPAPPEPSAISDDAQPYNPAGRRDPFRPFILDVRPEARMPLTPLQRYELGQLTVVATVWEAAVPRAMVEDSAGMGYIVGVGTPIGRNGGVVTAIEPERVVVEEHVLDYYGKEQVNRIVMETPKEDPNQPARERK
jgi:Tfp pilus assembly protein PilP